MGGPKKPTRTMDESHSPRWREESDVLRQILLDCGLQEERKWGKPCFTCDGNNIAIIQKMKAFLALMFFNGALLKDDRGALKSQGPNSHAARRLELTSMDAVLEAKPIIGRYVREAIANDKAGRKVTKKQHELVLPEELKARFARDPALAAAFAALTPGRQRGYNLHFSAPKGSEARARRIDKYAAKILSGKGFHDH